MLRSSGFILSNAKSLFYGVFHSENILLKNEVKYIDSIRIFVVTLLMLFYSMIPYSSIQLSENNWFIQGDSSFEVLDYILVMINCITYPFIFFFSGYFVMHALSKMRAREFFVLRLGKIVLWIIFCVTTLNVLPNYLKDITLEATELPYLDYWFNTYLKNLVTINNNVVLNSPVSIIMIIIFFTAVTGAIYFAFKKPFIKFSEKEFQWKQLVNVFFVTVITTLIFNLGYHYLGNLLQPEFFVVLEYIKFASYFIFFYCGLVCYQNSFFTKLKRINVSLWNTATIIFLILKAIYLTENFYEINRYFKYFVLYVVLDNLALFSSFIAITWYFSIFEYSDNKLLSNLANNVYFIYTIHFSVVITLQFILLNYNIAIMLKALLVFLLSLLLSCVGAILINKVLNIKIDKVF